jgi:hypothetical protein
MRNRRRSLRRKVKDGEGKTFHEGKDMLRITRGEGAQKVKYLLSVYESEVEKLEFLLPGNVLFCQQKRTKKLLGSPKPY